MEKQEFEDAIVKDLALMGIRPDKVSYTSDYFDQLYNCYLQIIKSGKAYADDTDHETMKNQQWDGIPIQRRDLSPEESLAHLEEMKKGTSEGLRWCIRAKISFDDKNKALHDPVIYRCNPATHHRTGDAWVIYPTYNFACPTVDSMEGVTHALRTIEYRDRNPQYQWMLDTLNLRTVQVWDFARMNFIRTLLSNRKLTKLVESGVVWGCDEDMVKATVTGCPATSYTEKRQKHVKNTALGEKVVAFSPSTVLEQVDAKSFKQDEEITLMNWGNAIVRKISTDGSTGKVTHLELELHMAGDVKKTEKKVTWLSTEGQTLVPVELVGFDYLLKKDSLSKDDILEDVLNFNTEFRVSGLADCNISEANVGDILQFDRKGFYRVDRVPAPGVPGVFFNIPTGKQK
ncbi:unnamed protein product [Penicillium egyptiacum]|uniref:Glutamyl-tRNA synthetase n=1 Tax=Penicillium egyptiacum TaxID=1303716 RepID=A0A9W4PB78_9EURO|nr:unnamed protein product [Penicillium egyptiacum]